MHGKPAPRGRGATDNPANRFDRLEYVPEPDPLDEETSAPATTFLKDTSRTIIATNESPDVGFDASINPYRGCEHGCVYCYARPTHEYLGFSAGLDFETRIVVKENAPELLTKKLASPSWRPKTLGISGVTDPYQPIEKKLRLTRRCLEVLAEFRNPAIIVTKNHLVTRDIDILRDMARDQTAAVMVSVTTLDRDTARTMEPRTSTPQRRLDAIAALAQAGIPVGVLVAPVVPGLTDHEMPAIIEQSTRAGARYAGYVMLRLPHGVKAIFERWLEERMPERKKKILSRVRSIRSGRFNDPGFVTRQRGSGVFAKQVSAMFEIACRRAGIAGERPELSTAAFRRAQQKQLSLFEKKG